MYCPYCDDNDIVYDGYDEEYDEDVWYCFNCSAYFTTD